MKGSFSLDVKVAEGKVTTTLSANLYEIRSAADCRTAIVIFETMGATLAALSSTPELGPGIKPEDTKDG